MGLRHVGHFSGLLSEVFHRVCVKKSWKSCGLIGGRECRERSREKAWAGGVGVAIRYLSAAAGFYLYGRRNADTLLLMRRMKERGSISLDSRVVYLK